MIRSNSLTCSRRYCTFFVSLSLSTTCLIPFFRIAEYLYSHFDTEVLDTSYSLQISRTLHWFSSISRTFCFLNSTLKYGICLFFRLCANFSVVAILLTSFLVKFGQHIQARTLTRNFKPETQSSISGRMHLLYL